MHAKQKKKKITDIKTAERDPTNNHYPRWRDNLFVSAQGPGIPGFGYE